MTPKNAQVCSGRQENGQLETQALAQEWKRRMKTNAGVAKLEKMQVPARIQIGTRDCSRFESYISQVEIRLANEE